jgi:16S rRNA (cytosine967-C5)-methyltransferase
VHTPTLKSRRPSVSARSLSAQAVARVFAGHSLSDILPGCLAQLPDARERALLQHLSYGTVRHGHYLQALLAQLLQKPLKAKEYEIEALLLIGLFQHLYSRIPEHAATAETVNAARLLGKSRATGLINAVLRNFQRRRDTLLATITPQQSAYYSHPQWLLHSLQEAWPQQWQEIVTAANQHPPLSLRVNRQQVSREAYQAALSAAGLEAQSGVYAPEALILIKPCDVSELPHFNQGWVSVQDEAAQLAAGLLQLEPGQRVLDACAAPGGKSAHILETCPHLELIALDAHAGRLHAVTDTLQRLQLHAHIHCAAAEDLETWWDGKPFERILLDAPCSATGVIRRHPDIKYLRRASDIGVLVEKQALLLDKLWQTLAPGGLLLYATCSILPVENVQQIIAFLSRHSDAQELPLTVEWGYPMSVGRQILPATMDGFYYALLRRT